ncbi:MAG: tetratricopeptide repeat protein [Pseudomonadota bacterium]
MAPGQAAPATAPASAAPEAEPAPPNLPLSGDLLYKIVKAELEFDKDNWQAPYRAMLALARETRDGRLAQRAADMALSARRPDQALAAARLWSTLVPGSPEAQRYFLGLVVLSERQAEAEPMLRLRLQGATPEARNAMLDQTQQLLAGARDRPAAGAMLARLFAPYANTERARVALARDAHERGQVALALREAQAARALAPDSELAALMLAKVTPDPVAAAAVLAEFLGTHAQAVPARLAYARMLIDQRRYVEARAQFAALHEGQPDNPDALYALGIMSVQLDDNAAAEGYLLRYTEVMAAQPDPERDVAKVFMLLAQLADQRKAPDAALGWLAKIGPDEPEAHFRAQLRRAELIGKQGRLDEARGVLDALAAPTPSAQAQVVTAKAQLLQEAGQIEAAYAVLQAGALRFPQDSDLLYDFALMAEKAGRHNVMERTLRAVIAQAPDKHHAYNALGYSLAERKLRLPEALALIAKALALAPDDPFIMDSMGWVQYRMGKLVLAEEYLRRAYALRSDPDIGVHLGEVLWQQGRQDEARALWRAARERDPKNDTLKSTLARLSPGF